MQHRPVDLHTAQHYEGAQGVYINLYAL